MIVLALPWILVFLLLLALFFAYKKRWLLCLGCMVLVGIGNYLGSVFAFNINCWGKTEGETKTHLKVLAWNVDGGNSDDTKNHNLFNIIYTCNPDIVFLSENYGQVNGILDKKLSSINLKRVDYPGDHGHWFYSRLPIKSIDVVVPECDSLAIIIKCKVVFEESIILFYGVHFSSNNFNQARKYMPADSICSNWSIIDYYKNTQYASTLRMKEAEQICNEIHNVQAPVLVLGDMNDVCSSDCINTLESAGLKDAWWSGGFGYGATINQPLPYRIDHIMYSERFRLQKIKVINSDGLSDHKALYAEFLIEEHKELYR